MRLIDFGSLPRLRRFYGGRAGRKVSVLFNGVPWLIKFPESTRDFHGSHLPSYITSPLSEYIGSKVYESLGIPVHKVRLGVCDDKVVVGFRDFAVDDTFADFLEIKNSVTEDDLEGSSNSSSLHGEPLRDAVNVIDRAELIDEVRDDSRTRFWDMFVVDAFTVNNDRNNGNWGVLLKRYSMEVAPVFDNGNSFYSKRNDSVIERRLEISEAAVNDLSASLSFYLDEDGRKIHPFAFMQDRRIPDLDAAIRRFADRLDLKAIDAVIDDIPEREGEHIVISPAQRVYYKTMLHTAANEFILPIVR